MWRPKWVPIEGERVPDKDTEAVCKHCFELIRKRRDESGNGFEWVAFLGINTNGSGLYGRFCQVAGEWRRMKPVRQHSPVPLHNSKKLEEWLDS